MSAYVGDPVDDRVLIEDCVRAATLAPSIYNSQPWRFRIHDGRMDVLADPLRSLPAVDPDGRDLHISLGAAVLNIKVMLAAHGIRPGVSLLPDLAEPDLVARIGRGGFLTPTLRDVAMVSALVRRETMRLPFEDRPLPLALVKRLTDAAVVEGARLAVLDDVDAHALLSLVRSADLRLRANPAYRAELASWTRDRPGRRDGVLPDSFGPRSHDAAMPLRDFGVCQPWLHRERVPFETNPTIAVLSTSGDGREDWLRAGMALERVLLEATIAGVSASFLTQPFEVADLRWRYEGVVSERATQMVIRLGYARKPGATRSPRRSVAEVLIDAC